MTDIGKTVGTGVIKGPTRVVIPSKPKPKETPISVPNWPKRTPVSVPSAPQQTPTRKTETTR